MVKKISIITISAFLITLFLLSVFINPIQNTTSTSNLNQKIEDDFYSNFNYTDKSIFLVGSSQVGRLNQTYIQEQINNKKSDYMVFNLAINSDSPKNRLNSISKIIELKPDLVVYGVSYMEFADFIIKTELSKPKSLLPDSAFYLKEIIINLENLFNLNFEGWNSAKVLTINYLKNMIGIGDKDDSEDITLKNSPFYNIRKSYTVVLDELSLKRSLESNKSQIEKIYREHENVEALKEIIKKFQTDEIPIVIFSIPVSNVMLETISEHDQERFEKVLYEISYETGIDIILLHNEFGNMDIWNDPIHLAYGSKSIIFNDKITSVILENLG